MVANTIFIDSSHALFVSLIPRSVQPEYSQPFATGLARFPSIIYHGAASPYALDKITSYVEYAIRDLRSRARGIEQFYRAAYERSQIDTLRDHRVGLCGIVSALDCLCACVRVLHEAEWTAILSTCERCIKVSTTSMRKF